MQNACYKIMELYKKHKCKYVSLLNSISVALRPVLPFINWSNIILINRIVWKLDIDHDKIIREEENTWSE